MMDLSVQPPNETIRKIEDIIDIQKANGGFCVRAATGAGAGGAGLARSLDSGLGKRKLKKQRSKRHTSPLPDVISWPSDSDITVLRLQLCAAGALLGAGGGATRVGDGPHRPDSASMVNLATLVPPYAAPHPPARSPPRSKIGLSADEYLLALSSWESAAPLPPRNSTVFPSPSTKSKLARFLRLYFCPCCTCLYELEKRRDEPSVYRSRRAVGSPPHC